LPRDVEDPLAPFPIIISEPDTLTSQTTNTTTCQSCCCSILSI